MTFLDFLAAQGDANAAHLREDLSGLADGANDLAAVVAYLRNTLGDSEAALAVEETAWRWKEWKKLQIAEKKMALHQLKRGDGFKLGSGPIAQREAQRRRAEISKMEAELSRKSSP